MCFHEMRSLEAYIGNPGNTWNVELTRKKVSSICIMDGSGANPGMIGLTLDDMLKGLMLESRKSRKFNLNLSMLGGLNCMFTSDHGYVNYTLPSSCGPFQLIGVRVNWYAKSPKNPKKEAPISVVKLFLSETLALDPQRCVIRVNRSICKDPSFSVIKRGVCRI